MYVCSTHTIFERTGGGHLTAFIEIAFISILSRRLVRLVTQEISARRLQTDSEGDLSVMWHCQA